MNFSQYNIQPEILKAIEAMGFQEPTEIQKLSFPILLEKDTDFMGLAATGTGKTAAFGIPLLQKIDVHSKNVQALVMCPTRELALQVKEQIEALGRNKQVQVAAVYGGAGYAEQLRQLRSGAHIVVGTPGRLIDHLQRRSLDLSGIKTVVLDEADEMISMGFRDDLESILSATPREQSQMWFFSATMDRQVSKIADTFLRNPQQIQINRKEVLSDKMEQFYFMVRESDKFEITCKLIDTCESFYGIIFCQTKQLVTEVTNKLIEKGYKADSLHGDKDQNARERTMQAFRQRKAQILVCTDVASRGLDVKEVTHVINYSLPRELENYVHRIGRTARSGRSGIAWNLVTPSHRNLIGKIESITKSRMQEGKIPTRKEVAGKKLTQLFDQFQKQTSSARALEVLSPDWKESLTQLTNEEIVARFITMMMPELFIDRPQKTYSTESSDRQRDGSRPRTQRSRSSGGSFSRSSGGQSRRRWSDSDSSGRDNRRSFDRKPSRSGEESFEGQSSRRSGSAGGGNGGGRPSIRDRFARKSSERFSSARSGR